MKQLCRAQGSTYVSESKKELLEMPIHVPFTTGPEDAPPTNSGSLTKKQEKLLHFEKGKGEAAWNKVSFATL